MIYDEKDYELINELCYKENNKYAKLDGTNSNSFYKQIETTIYDTSNSIYTQLKLYYVICKNTFSNFNGINMI